MENNHKKCLVLNADYTPLCIVTWKRALTWYMKYQDHHKYSIDILDFFKNDHIVGTNKNYPIPAVIKTKLYFRNKGDRVSFSRKNIFLRDDYTCQYCNKRCEHNNLTYDHVIPKSKWKYTSSSPTSWTNIVTCCVRCNHKKGNRTPKEANMILKINPYEPSKNFKYLPVSMHLSKIKDEIPNEWKAYLPEIYNI